MQARVLFFLVCVCACVFFWGGWGVVGGGNPSSSVLFLQRGLIPPCPFPKAQAWPEKSFRCAAEPEVIGTIWGQGLAKELFPFEAR